MQKDRLVLKGLGAVIASVCIAFIFNVSAYADNSILTNDGGMKVYVDFEGDTEHYHYSDCDNMQGKKREITLKEATDMQLSPCSDCNPPSYDANVATTKATTEVEEEVEASIGDDEADSSKSDSGKNSKKTTSDSSEKSTSNSTSKASASSGSKASSNSSSKSSSKTAGELLTEKQRKKLYASKTNPQKGTKPVTPARPAYQGYAYADFGTYNSYESENHLGGKPIYLLGTITDIVPFTEDGARYRVAMLVNDCDGYQWYMRVFVDKTKLEQFKADFMGKAANIYGGYAGYSGVLNRPMMDATIIIETTGKATDLTQYYSATPIAQTNNAVVNETMVWLSATGDKYHRINNCGNMNPNKATQITEKEAIAKKIGKCDDCWSE